MTVAGSSEARAGEKPLDDEQFGIAGHSRTAIPENRAALGILPVVKDALQQIQIRRYRDSGKEISTYELDALSYAKRLQERFGGLNPLRLIEHYAGNMCMSSCHSGHQASTTATNVGDPPDLREIDLGKN